MKKKSDPRHQHRQIVIQQLFEWGFRGEDVTKDNKFGAILSRIDTVDTLIQESAPQWPLDQINRVDLAVLRLATYELFFEPEVPSKVVIDEAIELGKEFGTDSSSSFINGVLGNIMQHYEQYKERF